MLCISSRLWEVGIMVGNALGGQGHEITEKKGSTYPREFNTASSV
ncbi:hypothetical protein SOASR016_07910 [Pectobacterium carotovorum subsp. carotovorum]|uniref:Uncharacterized protein n=1 Tax=Pectobacterium carotovorum subsp. carotovorum TaxID=555 RepID=A0ABQ5L3A1_PECCC|nr:hypothetical protein SOASR014_38960 [Pectobacterium carotovorum subsp. carotovorum]GKX46039.1 hypothetical protein SOASR016_07910 [Pectobacterium carotovorum subsp. carotovorum]GLX43762.1 hypothetical protein Pcaca01_14300 [Pectobacterium carotovorum subsp. carotovorum]